MMNNIEVSNSMKLQSLLYPTKQICNEEALYLHREGSLLLFDGFFNLFYLKKHHKYCDIESLSLELYIKGIKKLQIMHDRDVIDEIVIKKPVVSGMERLKGVAPEPVSEDDRISIELPYNQYDQGVFWFKAEIDEIATDWDIAGFYCADRDKVDVSPIEIAVNICTYKREKYVVRNMRSLMEWLEKTDIDGNRQEVADHLHVFIVDNAKTLMSDADFCAVTNVNGGEDQYDLIRVIPNANTGGTGGFSRGMMEAIDRKEALGLTHLLMMDDDAVFDPELFVRLYGFLSCLRGEYSEITVAGALMREDYPYIQHAAGEWYGQFKVHNDHIMADLRDFSTCTSDWMTRADNAQKAYGAWWCCCYHMNAITLENLPLPIFVHHDDIQFGLKQMDRGIVFLNGINVWHQGFELVFPGVKQYYNMRNTLITSISYEPDYLKKHLKAWAIKRYIGMLISYRYGDCDFVYRGLMDFLRGKSWLMDSDPEALHKELMASYAARCPFVVKENLKNSMKYDVSNITPKELRSYYTHTRFNSSLFKKLSFNGWFLPADKEIKVITPLDSPWETYRHKRILLYEPATGKGCIMKRSNKELIKGALRMIRMAVAIDAWKFGGGIW